LFTTNPTWTDLGSNPGLRGERPATKRLSHNLLLCSCKEEMATEQRREIGATLLENIFCPGERIMESKLHSLFFFFFSF
jgi:hypothetical protein